MVKQKRTQKGRKTAEKRGKKDENQKKKIKQPSRRLGCWHHPRLLLAKNTDRKGQKQTDTKKHLQESFHKN